MKRTLLLVGCCLLGLLAATAVIAPASAVAQDDEFPRAEAGLDQTVQRNASVLLDATESFSPAGDLVEYNWHVTTPGGASLAPDCDASDCSLARFRATELGQYEVVLAVEDDEGRRETDTMYVSTVPRGDFGVELTGPDASDQEGNLTATVSPGDSTPENMTWYQGDRELANQSVPGLGGVFNHSAYLVPGVQYRVVVQDEWGRTVSDTWTAPGGGSWTPATPSSDEYPRIEGPAVVTGDPDRTNLYGNQDWYYNSATYVIRTSRFGSVSNGLWTLFGSGTPKTYNADGTMLSPPLSPGSNRIVADLEIERRIEDMQDQEANNGTERRTLIDETSEATTVRRSVVVDPAPQIYSFTAAPDEDAVDIEYEVEDKYDYVESLSVYLDGTQVLKSNSKGPNPSGFSTFSIPDGNYGQTDITLKVEDGRGQVTTTSTVVDLPAMESADMVEDSIAEIPSDESSQGGTSPPSTYTG